MAFGNKIQDICYPRAWTTYQIDSNDAIYIGEVNGTNVKKFVKK